MRGNKGFTLIELLIVITIIGILTVLGARQFGSATVRASAVADFSNAQTFSSAIRQALLMDASLATVTVGTKAAPSAITIDGTGKILAGTIDITSYVSSLPAPRLAEVAANGWYAYVNGATQEVIVYVKNGSTFIQLSPRSTVANYYTTGDGAVYKEGL